MKKRKAEQPPRILVVDDHALIRMALNTVIQEQGWVATGDADDAESTLRLLRQKPDLILLDFYLSAGECIDLIRQIRARDARVRILMISSSGDPVSIMRALRAGANGFMLKEDSETRLVKAIQDTLDGKSVISESVSGDVLKMLSEPPGKGILSEREYEVLRLLALGRTTKEIAADLGISPRTVGTHRERLKDKLELKDANELLVYAVRHADRHRRGSMMS